MFWMEMIAVFWYFNRYTYPIDLFEGTFGYE